MHLQAKPSSDQAGASVAATKLRAEQQRELLLPRMEAQERASDSLTCSFKEVHGDRVPHGTDEQCASIARSQLLHLVFRTQPSARAADAFRNLHHRLCAPGLGWLGRGGAGSCAPTSTKYGCGIILARVPLWAIFSVRP